LIREEMLKISNKNICIVRPTLVYGINDPHNGYGPNKFIRLGQMKKKIVLYGKGEERRDHINVKDVGAILYLLFKRRFIGRINIVTGKTCSFYKIGKQVSKVYGNKLKYIKRTSPMPHKGYRAFNNILLKKICAKYKFIDVLDWISKKEDYKRH